MLKGWIKNGHLAGLLEEIFSGLLTRST